MYIYISINMNTFSSSTDLGAGYLYTIYLNIFLMFYVLSVHILSHSHLALSKSLLLRRLQCQQTQPVGSPGRFSSVSVGASICISGKCFPCLFTGLPLAPSLSLRIWQPLK